MTDEREEEFFESAGRNLTFIYSEFIVRFRMITEMIDGTK